MIKVKYPVTTANGTTRMKVMYVENLETFLKIVNPPSFEIIGRDK